MAPQASFCLPKGLAGYNADDLVAGKPYVTTKAVSITSTRNFNCSVPNKFVTEMAMKYSFFKLSVRYTQ